MESKLDAYILCGGEGTRLKPVTGNTPKPLVKINDKVLLDLIIDNLSTQRIINRIVLLAKYKHEDFKKYYHNKLFNNKKVEILVQKDLLGTGGAVIESLQNHSTKKVIVLNGDTIIKLNFDRILNNSILNKENIIFCSHVRDIREFGFVKVNRENQLITFDEKRLSKKAKSGLAYAGVAIFDSSFLEKLKFNKKVISLEKDIISRNKDTFYVEKIEDVFLDVGTPERFIVAKNSI